MHQQEMQWLRRPRLIPAPSSAPAQEPTWQEARLNSPHTKWPYQPKVLRASPHSLSTPQPPSLETMAGLSHPLQTHGCPLTLLRPWLQYSWAGLGRLYPPGWDLPIPLCQPVPVSWGDIRVPTQGCRDGGKHSSPLLPAGSRGGICRAPMGQGAAPSGCLLPPTRAPSPSTAQGPGGAVNHCQTRVHSWAL